MYYPNTNAILYVVDAHDRSRFSKAAEELSKVLEVTLQSPRRRYSKESLSWSSPTSRICLIRRATRR
jgi:GTPase SAR1 family protein